MVEVDFGQISAYMLTYLQERGVHAVAAWKESRHCEHCVTVVSLRGFSLDSPGLGDYLGEIALGETRAEVFGKRCRLRFGMDLYALVRQGETAVERELDLLMTALSERSGGGFSLEQFSVGESEFDKENGRLRRKVEMECLLYLYNVEGFTEPLFDLNFKIEGVLKNGNSDE